MKAIINVKKGSAYAKFNGHTFEVKTLFSTGISVTGMSKEFPDNQTDFSHTEIMIVDIAEELKTANENHYLSSHRVNLVNLQNYCISNKIKYSL